MIYLKAMGLVLLISFTLFVLWFLILFGYEMWSDSELKRDLMARKKRRNDK